MDDLDVGVLVSTSPATQTFLSDFRALLYSRPIFLVIHRDASALIVPGLEEAHAKLEAAVDVVHAYYEHPEGAPGSPLELLEAHLRSGGSAGNVGVELTTCPAGLARRLADAGRDLVDLDPVLTRMREVKDAGELAAIAEAARVTTVGVSAALGAAYAGATELDVDSAGTRAVLAEVARIGRPATIEELVMSPSGAKRSALPHAFSTTRRLRAADGLIHTRQVGLDGYRAELERTVFIGQPDPDQRRAFEVMRAAQDAAIRAVRAGVPCRDVDRAARARFDDAGFARHAIHRTGHGIGLAPHESPYLRFDETCRLDEGMVITIEPGIYVDGLGGFRHSDTVVVRADGAQMLTEYPSDLATLVHE